jgi:hypothetical protein
LAPDGVVGQPQTRDTLQVLLEDRDGPVHRGVAQLVGALVQAGQQQRLQLVGPHAGAAHAVAVLQGGGLGRFSEGPDPVEDALAGDAQRLRDFGDGFAPVQFQQGHEAAVVTGVIGDAQLALKLAALRRS